MLFSGIAPPIALVRAIRLLSIPLPGRRWHKKYWITFYLLLILLAVVFSVFMLSPTLIRAVITLNIVFLVPFVISTIAVRMRR